MGGLLKATLCTSAGVSGIVCPLESGSSKRSHSVKPGLKVTGVHPVTPDPTVAVEGDKYIESPPMRPGSSAQPSCPLPGRTSQTPCSDPVSGRRAERQLHADE